MPYRVPACAFRIIGITTIRLPAKIVRIACHQFMPPPISEEASMYVGMQADMEIQSAAKAADSPSPPFRRHRRQVGIDESISDGGGVARVCHRRRVITTRHPQQAGALDAHLRSGKSHACHHWTNLRRAHGFVRRLQRSVHLQIAGTINAYCALLAEREGFRALYLSGAGVANASRGIPDLGMTTLDDVLTDALRITAATRLPLLVDIDTGWDDPARQSAR
jgi:hypothetical protein